MNPFDLRGPEFLLFYFCFSLAVIIAIVVLRRRAESGDAPRIDLGDPYLIAYLRGGEDEALRLAVISLVDRGALAMDGKFIRRADHVTSGMVKYLIEYEALKKFGALLVVMMLAAMSIAAVFSFPRLTALGKATLEDITNLYSGLRTRINSFSPGGGSAELAMFAAVFGVAALAGTQFAYAEDLFRRTTSSSIWGTSASSSCGTSACSSGGSSDGGSSCGGSSDGGGGCGGGGCGGCGSS